MNRHLKGDRLMMTALVGCLTVGIFLVGPLGCGKKGNPVPPENAPAQSDKK